MSVTYRLPAGTAPTLQITRRPAAGPAVLYVHGATFPAALSVDYAIDGLSWTGDLNARGLDAWAFDFAGYGGSDPAPVAGRASDVAPQIERVAAHILGRSGRERLAVIAHSWGAIPAGMFAARCPQMVDRIVLFGPPAQRNLVERPPAPMEDTKLVSAEDQWRAFQWGVPTGEPSPIAPQAFASWAALYLATDRDSHTRTPPAVRVPAGPDRDIADAWTGAFPYDPRDVRAPALIVRGEWDALTMDEDARWLMRKLPNARDVKLRRGAHRMHLETNRRSLFDAVGTFLTSPV